jgi:hypothetical protein
MSTNLSGDAGKACCGGHDTLLASESLVGLNNTTGIKMKILVYWDVMPRLVQANSCQATQCIISEDLNLQCHLEPQVLQT